MVGWKAPTAVFPHCALSAKHRRKGMVIILCVCLSVWKFLRKLWTLAAETSSWQTSNYTRIKKNNNRLLKPFGYKVIPLTVTVSRLEKTPGDVYTHLNITATVSSSTYFKWCHACDLHTCKHFSDNCWALHRGPFFLLFSWKHPLSPSQFYFSW